MSQSDKRKGKRTPDEASRPSRGAATAGFAPVTYPPGPASGFGEYYQQIPQPVATASEYLGYGSSQGNTSIPPPGKLPITPIRSSQSAAGSSKPKQGRTSHACDTCRRAKAGCSGGQPCVRCKAFNATCVYGDGKRDRDRKRLVKFSQDINALSRTNYELVAAFRRIRNNTSLSANGMREEMDEVLATASDMRSSDSGRTSTGIQDEPSDFQREMSNNDDDDISEVGSTESINIVNLDTDRDDTRPTGFMGKASSVVWAKRTAEAYAESQGNSVAPSRDDQAYIISSYHTEDIDFEEIDNSHIDQYAWPSIPEIHALLEGYFDHIHDALPLVNKHTIIARLETFDRSSRDLIQEDANYLATLNMMFAISSVYLQLTKSPGSSRHASHLVYLERAKMLCTDQNFLYQDARVSSVCVLGLMCTYFLSVCRLNRAWIFGGLALRQGFTLALHNRNESELPDGEKEYRVRLWWSIFDLECLLNELTGRPSGISLRDISTPQPVDVDEEILYQTEFLYSKTKIDLTGHSSREDSHDSRDRSPAIYHADIPSAQPLAYTFPAISPEPTTSTYFIYRTQLSILSHEIITQIYCASSSRDKWSQTQAAIHSIDIRLQRWKDSLPPSYAIEVPVPSEIDWDEPHTQEQQGLAMLFHSSNMILFRPCLCQFSGKKDSSTRVGRAQEFDETAVDRCIAGARAMIAILQLSFSLPVTRRAGTMGASKLYLFPPFWPTLHYLAESLSVLLLELAYQATHVSSEQASEILEDVITGIKWLSDMSATSVSARKAWEIFDRLVRMVVPQDSAWKLEELPTHAGVPPGYKRRRFEGQGPGQQQEGVGFGTSQQEHSHLRPMDPTGLAFWESTHVPYFTQPAPANPFSTPIASGSSLSGLGQGQSQHQQVFGDPNLQQFANTLQHGDAVHMFNNLTSRYSGFGYPWDDMFHPGTMDLGGQVDPALNANVGGIMSTEGMGSEGPFSMMNFGSGDPEGGEYGFAGHEGSYERFQPPRRE